MVRVILASASPRRKELLALLGIPFEVVPAQGEEKKETNDPEALVRALSDQKATEVYERLTREASEQENAPLLVIGADTVVAIAKEILGKPKDEADAAAMLRRLSGQTHEVYTGVTVLTQDTKTTFFECTKVTFYEMSDAEIAAYIATGDPMDKAGAYGIQSGGVRFVKSIFGDYTNVVGLPVSRLYQELKSLKMIEQSG